MPWAQVHLGTGVAAAVLLVLRFIIRSDDFGSIDTEFKLDRKFGLVLAVIAAIVVAVGGVTKPQETDSIPPPSGGGPGTAPF